MRPKQLYDDWNDFNFNDFFKQCFESDTLDLNITGKKHNVGTTKEASVQKSQIFPKTVYVFWYIHDGLNPFEVGSVKAHSFFLKTITKVNVEALEELS